MEKTCQNDVMSIFHRLNGYEYVFFLSGIRVIISYRGVSMLPIKRMNIQVSKLELNNKFISGTFQLNHQIKRQTGKIADHVYFTELQFEVKDHADTVYPLNISVYVRANIEFHVAEKEDDIIAYLKKDAVNILYPYLRSTVSQLTALAMIPPVVIPVVDTTLLFKDDDILN